METVFTTTEYEKFTPLLKALDKERQKKVFESFKKYGYMSCPITVNEKFQIIDGRARFEACRKLNIPVEYVVFEGAGVQDCYMLNRDKGTWTKEDFKHTKPEIKKAGNSIILCNGCKEYDKILLMIDQQIEYWIKQKLRFEGKLDGKEEKELQDTVKAARREYQRRFYEKHPEKRKQYQNKFYKEHAAELLEDPEQQKSPGKAGDLGY